MTKPTPRKAAPRKGSSRTAAPRKRVRMSKATSRALFEAGAGKLGKNDAASQCVTDAARLFLGAPGAVDMHGVVRELARPHVSRFAPTPSTPPLDHEDMNHVQRLLDSCHVGGLDAAVATVRELRYGYVDPGLAVRCVDAANVAFTNEVNAYRGRLDDQLRAASEAAATFTASACIGSAGAVPGYSQDLDGRLAEAYDKAMHLHAAIDALQATLQPVLVCRPLSRDVLDCAVTAKDTASAPPNESQAEGQLRGIYRTTQAAFDRLVSTIASLGLSYVEPDELNTRAAVKTARFGSAPK